MWLAEPPPMRLPPLALAATLLSGCSAAPARRNALAPLPSLAPSLAAAEGVSLGARAPLWRARGEEPGSAVTYPQIQPELGAVVRAKDDLFVHAALSVSPVAGAGAAEPGLPDPPTEPSWSLTTGAGYDVSFGPGLGALVAGEVGFRLIRVRADRISGAATLETSRLTFDGSLGLAPHVDFGDLRLFAGLGIASDTYSALEGTVSGSCSLGCDSGSTTTVGVGMLGLGVRYRVSPSFAASLQAWWPVGRHQMRHPVNLTLTLHIGDFAVGSSKKGGELPEPKGPPPLPYPEESPTPVPLSL